MENKLITFVVPAYNAEDTIERTIESILNQTSERYKIIIINDGSTDGTDRIGRLYQEKYPEKIKYVYQENRGLGGARNHGMELTSTKYISFLDSDDWLMPEFVEKIVFQIDNTTECPEIIMTLPQIYHEDSRLVEDWYDKKLFCELFSRDGVCTNPQKDKRLFQTDVNQCRKTLSIEFIKRIKFQFREQVKWEDVYPHFYLLSHCKSCMGIGSVGFYYRKGSPTQITATRGKDRLDLIVVYNDLLEYVRKYEYGKKYAEELKFPMMRIMTGFANEAIRMADTDTRQILTDKLYYQFKRIHKSFYRALKKEGKKYCTKSEMRQYLLFMVVIKNKLLIKLFYDYLYRDFCENMVKRIIGKSV